MKLLIEIYLLAKSVFKRRFTWFDIGLAKLVRDDQYREFDKALSELFGEEVKREEGDALGFWVVPEFVRMIAGMEQEEILPEAFSNFVWNAENWLYSRIGLKLED